MDNFDLRNQGSGGIFLTTREVRMLPPGERGFTMYSSRSETVLPSASRPISGMSLLGTAVFLLASGPASPALAASKRCDWHGPKTQGETSYKQCVDYAALDETTLNLPSNATRISRDGISFCPNAINGSAGAADIVYMMDNSGSMERGENGGDFNTPPGDPFGIRDRVIRSAMRQQRATADTSTAGFISFIGLGSKQDQDTTPAVSYTHLTLPTNREV